MNVLYSFSERSPDFVDPKTNGITPRKSIFQYQLILNLRNFEFLIIPFFYRVIGRVESEVKCTLL